MRKRELNWKNPQPSAIGEHLCDRIIEVGAWEDVRCRKKGEVAHLGSSGFFIRCAEHPPWKDPVGMWRRKIVVPIRPDLWPFLFGTRSSFLLDPGAGRYSFRLGEDDEDMGQKVDYKPIFDDIKDGSVLAAARRLLADVVRIGVGRRALHRFIMEMRVRSVLES